MYDKWYIVLNVITLISMISYLSYYIFIIYFPIWKDNTSLLYLLLMCIR